MEDHHQHLFIILVCFLSIETTVPFVSAADNPKFIACEPKKCENSNLTISYPFWIPDEQESYCGHPDFQINCSTNNTTIDDEFVNNQPPILQISNEDYIIRDIFYDNRTFRVTNAKSFNNPCPSPLRNLTFDYAGSPFSFGPNHADLFFFYNCTLVPSDYFTYALPCFTYNTTNGHQYQSFATVIHEGGLQYLNSTSEKCGSMVGAPIEQMELASMTKMDYTDVLRRGFVLQWNLNNCRECEESGGRCGFDNNDFVCFCQDNTDHRHPKTCKAPRSKKRKVAIGVGAGVAGFFLACLFVFLFFYLRRRKNRRSISSNLISQKMSPDSSLKPDPENGSTYFATPIFSYKELEEATNNFDSNRELGDGGFGTVYRGELRDGRVVAVKRLYENNFKRVEQFMNEVNILSLLRHENLVTLYGCTSRHSRELLLVYEYVPNGTVADHIHGELAKAGLATWPIRMNIAIESAGALKYLHASDIIHRDVKTNNILLDKNFHVKVADFGLSRLFPTDVTHVSTAPQGTPGYVDPEYYQCYQLTDKSDVYSFGVVLIELISSKPAVDISRHRHDINLANMAINKIQNHSLSELVDPHLGFETDSRARRMITSVAELAFRCLQQDRDMRPSMVEVLEVLKGIEGEEYNVKAVEVDIPADHDVVRLLKNSTAPFSPVSVTDKWGSVASTPNTSS